MLINIWCLLEVF